MKIPLLITAILGSMMLNAQSTGEIQKDLFDHLQNDVLILTKSGLLEDTAKVAAFVASFKTSNGKGSTYKKEFSIAVNKSLDYEIGEILADSKLYFVMFLKNKADNSGPKIEFLIIHEKTASQIAPAEIDKARNNWMELCNAHQAAKLVEQLYMADAYYYNRGRLLRGTKALASEYGYMNSPDYSLKLTPKHLTFVSSDLVYEIGQCSGSYPLPYMLVWKKQEDNKWQILMDSNY